MNNLTVFEFESHKVRFVGTPEDPWWVAVDVCRVLGIKNTTQALEKLDDDERSMFNIDRQGKAWCINESGLYTLILTSRKPQTKRFKKWITSEVIPAIRRTGSYSTQQPAPKIQNQLEKPTPQQIAESINLVFHNVDIQSFHTVAIKTYQIEIFYPHLAAAMTGIRICIQQTLGLETEEAVKPPSLAADKPTPHQICEAIDAAFSSSEVHSNYIAKIKAEQIATYYPYLTRPMDAAKFLLLVQEIKHMK